MMQKISFRADAGVQTGYGHFIRTLALADMLKDDFDCTFYTLKPTQYQVGELAKVCRFVALKRRTADRTFLESVSGEDIVVLDNYYFDTCFQRKIKNYGCKLVCVDDIHDKHFVADVVINHGLNDERLFDTEPYTKLCLGLDWALLRKPFLQPPNKGISRDGSIAVSMGGADPYRLTDAIVRELRALNLSCEIKVLLGDKVYLSEENRQGVTVLNRLSAEEICFLFRHSSVGIMSASSVCIEALYCQLPLLVGYYVDNQYEFYQQLKRQNLITDLGNLHQIGIRKIARALCAGPISGCGFDGSNIRQRYRNLFLSL